MQTTANNWQIFDICGWVYFWSSEARKKKKDKKERKKKERKEEKRFINSNLLTFKLSFLLLLLYPSLVLSRRCLSWTWECILHNRKCLKDAMLYHIYSTKQWLSSTDQAYNVNNMWTNMHTVYVMYTLYVLPKIQLSALTSIIVLDCRCVFMTVSIYKFCIAVEK